LRTLDSVVRARKIFGVTSMVVVSQRLHVERARYRARANGIDAAEFTATDVGGPHGIKASIRDAFARVKPVLDVHLLRAKPHFGGPQIPIGLAEAN
jgi:SanA protein